MHSHENIDASQRRKNVVDEGTLEFVRCALENCRCICRQMGRCGMGYDLCRTRKDLDISSLVTLTCDVSTMKSRLEQSIRLVEVGQWIAELIHDIKHPAAAISTAAQTLQGLPNLENPAFRLATIIREEVVHLNKLVDGLLYMVRPKQLEFRAYEVNEIIDKMMPVIKEKACDNGNITIRWQPSQDRAVVWVDADQMEQVFMNIVVNALEVMPEGGILSISTKAYQDTISIVFTDTGFGIPAEDLDKIFNPFHSTKTGGTGLGLAIARRIVETHNGYIEVTSKVGTSSTFTVTLPRFAE